MEDTRDEEHMNKMNNDYDTQNESKRKSRRRKSGKSAKYNMAEKGAEKRAEISETRQGNAEKD